MINTTPGRLNSTRSKGEGKAVDSFELQGKPLDHQLTKFRLEESVVATEIEVKEDSVVETQVESVTELKEEKAVITCIKSSPEELQVEAKSHACNMDRDNKISMRFDEMFKLIAQEGKFTVEREVVRTPATKFLPEKPKVGDTRNGPIFREPGFGSELQRPKFGRYEGVKDKETSSSGGNDRDGEPSDAGTGLEAMWGTLFEQERVQGFGTPIVNGGLSLVVALICLDKCKTAEETLKGIALFQHVDTSRAKEVADSVMVLLLGLIWHTDFLSYDCDEVKGKALPPAAKRMDTLNNLLLASDLVWLHCAVTNETVQTLNAEMQQRIKPGVCIVNTSSNHLVDDCVLKHFLIDRTVAGCALDGAKSNDEHLFYNATGVYLENQE